jgi:replicative DNA helicase
MTPAKLLTREEVGDISWTPNDAVAAALATIEARRTTVGVGVRLGLPGVDDYLCPCRPGELITVIGMSSNYKSGLMQYWARETANMIVKENVLNECVVYVTWEQAIEEMLAFDLATTARMSATDIMQGKVSDEEMERLRLEHGGRRSMMPLYLIGHSIAEGKRRPRLTLDNVAQALEFIKKEHDIKPRVIFLDYLQQIDPGQGEDRRMQVFYNVYRCKDMSLAMACPVVIGCQAGRSVYKEEKWGVPGMADGLESSNIEHTSDKMLGVWMPKTTMKSGQAIEESGVRLDVSDNLLILQVLKQKMGPAGKWFPLYVDPARNEIRSMDTEQEPKEVPW